MVAHRSVTGYFGAPVKQLKRKGNPSAENTGVIEKKHCDSPTIPVRKFRVSWKETFPCRVVHDVNDNTLYKRIINCISTLLPLKILYILSEFQQ